MKLVLWFVGCCMGFVWAEPMRMDVCSLPAETQSLTTLLNPQYLVFRPVTSSPNEKQPLLIYLHGGGGKGTDILRHRNASPVKYFNACEEQPFVIVVPQCQKGGEWQTADLDVWLEHLQLTLDFDPDRVYLTGSSMGGFGTWAWGAASPEYFAAIAPLAGGLGLGGPKAISPDLAQWLDSLVEIPVWAFHGAMDSVVPADRSERMVEGLEKRGAQEVRLTIYPDLGHNIGKTYWDPALYEWFLSHSR